MLVVGFQGDSALILPSPYAHSRSSPTWRIAWTIRQDGPRVPVQILLRPTKAPPPRHAGRSDELRVSYSISVLNNRP